MAEKGKTTCAFILSTVLYRPWNALPLPQGDAYTALLLSAMIRCGAALVPLTVAIVKGHGYKPMAATGQSINPISTLHLASA